MPIDKKTFMQRDARHLIDNAMGNIRAMTLTEVLEEAIIEAWNLAIEEVRENAIEDSQSASEASRCLDDLKVTY